MEQQWVTILCEVLYFISMLNIFQPIEENILNLLLISLLLETTQTHKPLKGTEDLKHLTVS